MTYVSVPKEDHDHDERDHTSLSLALPPPNNIPPNAPSKRHRPIVIGALLAITVCLGMAIVILHDIPSVPKRLPTPNALLLRQHSRRSPHRRLPV
ncbi:hypothetical protein RU639_005804 [Aspergillus parasiticus]